MPKCGIKIMLALLQLTQLLKHLNYKNINFILPMFGSCSMTYAHPESSKIYSR